MKKLRSSLSATLLTMSFGFLELKLRGMLIPISLVGVTVIVTPTRVNTVLVAATALVGMAFVSRNARMEVGGVEGQPLGKRKAFTLVVNPVALVGRTMTLVNMYSTTLLLSSSLGTSVS